MSTISQRYGNLSPLKQALLALEEMGARLAKSERERLEPIAIIGMGCRFPGAADPAAFWRLMDNGVDAVKEIPDSRWSLDDLYDADPDAPGKMSSRWAGLLDSVDTFDPEFFGISPREAVAMDPQQRLLLEVAWEALENAGQGPRTLALGQTGVFIGMTGDEYAQLFYQANDLAVFNTYFASGIARSVASGRISYVLGLQGPNLSIDTACSSSLVAVHTACLNLRMGECRVAIAGGSNVVLSPEVGIAFSKAHMMAPDGRCKAFDSRADGFVRGEGCGIVVLKRLSDALADSDNILAVIRGSAVNQDGRSSGLTVPNAKSQEGVIRQALANGGVKPEEISFVETHGTGTSLGDPIEAHALAAVLGPGRTAENPLVVGSVKTNVGHLESTAGVAGLIKLVLSLQHETIPANLHFQKMNPHIDWNGVPVEIPVAARAWGRLEKKRIAGVSAFGFSGTNAHVVVEEAPAWEERARDMQRPLHILALSARNETALRELEERYVAALENSAEALGDICFTANAGRIHFEQRMFVVGATVEEIRGKLQERKTGTEAQERGGVRPVFLFSGQGAQYAGMGKQLYDTQPVFRKAIDACEELLKGELEKPLREVMWGGATEELEQTAYTQPALFALEYAMSEMWKSWGIVPGVVLGHSVGEYVAACVAGVYSLADGIKLMAARGRLMQGVSGRGAMAAVMAKEEGGREALRGLEERVSIAGLNGPESVVISGYAEEVEIAEERLKREEVRVQRLGVSHGFHSPRMAEMAEEFEGIAN
ncbi:MAG TPA: type I polyketide synthase, partial [Candidatus Acidoferrales bacterium]|nr:type I polyketide synthase [Candidatus Acidoferrales bacterium]